MSAMLEEKEAAFNAWVERNRLAIDERFELVGAIHQCGSSMLMNEGDWPHVCPGCRYEVPTSRELTNDEAKPLYAWLTT